MDKNFMGSVIFTEQITRRSATMVKAAAEAAGIDEKLVRELNKKFVFIRAMNELKKEGLVAGSDGALKDKLVDDELVCSFQFSKRFIESQGAHYDRACVVHYSKETGGISCEDDTIRAVAEDLFRDKLEQWVPTDINTLCKRVLTDRQKRLHLRNGVYFVPRQAEAEARKVKLFLDALGVVVWVFPIGVGNPEYGLNLQKAIVLDMKKEVERLTKLTEDMKGDNTMTPRKARTKRAELREELRRYRELARATQVSMKDLLKSAGEAGDVLALADTDIDGLIATAQNRKKVPGLLLDLMEADDEVNDDAVALIRPKKNGSATVLDDAEDADNVPDMARRKPQKMELELS